MYVPSCPHVFQDPLLEIKYRVERVRHVLVLLDVADDFGGLGSLGKIDQLGVLDHRRNAVLDESKVGQVYT